MSLRYCSIDSFLGPLWIAESAAGLCELSFDPLPDAARVDEPGPVAAQLSGFFAGERRDFDLALDLRGTDFQTQVWRRVAAIPFGETASYGQIAQELGDRSASRAVGAANAKNPIAIVIPCHRVVAKGGALTGYRWGMERKQQLLDFEAAAIGRPVAHQQLSLL